MAVEARLAALRVVAAGRSRCAVQDALGSIGTGDLRFSVGVDLGEGQSGDESPHSKVVRLSLLQPPGPDRLVLPQGEMVE